MFVTESKKDFGFKCCETHWSSASVLTCALCVASALLFRSLSPYFPFLHFSYSGPERSDNNYRRDVKLNSLLLRSSPVCVQWLFLPQFFHICVFVSAPFWTAYTFLGFFLPPQGLDWYVFLAEKILWSDSVSARSWLSQPVENPALIQVLD